MLTRKTTIELSGNIDKYRFELYEDILDFVYIQSDGNTRTIPISTLDLNDMAKVFKEMADMVTEDYGWK